MYVCTAIEKRILTTHWLPRKTIPFASFAQFKLSTTKREKRKKDKSTSEVIFAP
jgi:hypothetical protein